RRAGVLLHPSSLPGPDGIGDLGAPARRFVEFLAHAGQAVWQVLPLAPTGYGDSPYQALSAFAGNPLLVSLEDLCQEGWLAEADWKGMPAFGTGEVDYPLVSRFKLGLLRRAADRFQALASPAEREALRTFREREAAWVEDLALFLVLKDRYQGAPWIAWDRALALRDPRAMEAARRDYAAEVSAQVFVQWVFDRQWSGLRAHACAHGISLMGDLPIYLAHDSAEVWARPWLFRLDPQGVPRAVAGVPPDYFSATGQLWGNPLYDWTAQASDGFTFWVERMRQTLRLYDLVRLDHFRGFEAYWEVPAGAPTAQDGKWVKGPGAAVFEAMEASLGHLPIVAENLGVITPEVEALRHRFGFPGMAILQFAFGKDPQADSFKPHNYGRDLVAYTGTHDNDTTLGWWASKAGAASIRTAEDIAAERAHAMAYLATDGSEMNWVLIRGVYASVADLAMAPLQDLLGLGSEARMNIPAVASGNWRWRCEEGALAPEVARRARALAQLYGRA
ncbi:MAG TPA: 4-alpha-glucanotransferase, partial [Anaeromyxobacteraceae bacterium]|nr:4-alpha-glucanotransferase [Anaeromyxobacteraceae bacterium]